MLTIVEGEDVPASVTSQRSVTADESLLPQVYLQSYLEGSSSRNFGRSRFFGSGSEEDNDLCYHTYREFFPIPSFLSPSPSPSKEEEKISHV